MRCSGVTLHEYTSMLPSSMPSPMLPCTPRRCTRKDGVQAKLQAKDLYLDAIGA